MFFRGRHVHTIDNKGRLSIPATFRTELAARSEKPPVITNVKNCLALYPYEDWLEIEETLAGASQLRTEVQAYQRFVISGAVEAPIDGQGRILIPPYLREHAHFDRELTIAGVGPRIEIWDKSLFDEDLQRTYARFDEISSVVAKSDT